MNFKLKSNNVATVKVRQNTHPVVFITELALNKMFIFTKEIATEVGWLGTVKRNQNHFLIEDVFLLKQEVHATTTEITSEGLTAFAEEILAKENGFDMWNEMRMWGHSHVNMGITPSGQDNSQMEVFSSSGHEFFIRLICNKKGELAVDVYDFETGMEYHGANWQVIEERTEKEIEINNIMDEIEKKYQELQKEKNEIKEGKIKELETVAKEEIKDKVKKFATTYVKTLTTNSNYKWKENLIDGINNTVESLFSKKELYQMIMRCFTAYEVKLYVDDMYPEIQITYQDAVKIFNHAKSLNFK